MSFKKNMERLICQWLLGMISKQNHQSPGHWMLRTNMQRWLLFWVLLMSFPETSGWPEHRTWQTAGLFIYSVAIFFCVGSAVACCSVPLSYKKKYNYLWTYESTLRGGPFKPGGRKVSQFIFGPQLSTCLGMLLGLIGAVWFVIPFSEWCWTVALLVLQSVLLNYSKYFCNCYNCFQ